MLTIKNIGNIVNRYIPTTSVKIINVDALCINDGSEVYRFSLYNEHTHVSYAITIYREGEDDLVGNDTLYKVRFDETDTKWFIKKRFTTTDSLLLKLKSEFLNLMYTI